MSVSRDVIANALEVPEAIVRCSACVYSEKFINKMLTCRFWDQVTMGDNFCSFWNKKGEKNESN